MNRKLSLIALVVALCVALTGLTAQAIAAPGSSDKAQASKKKNKKHKKNHKRNKHKKHKKKRHKVYVVCKHGCKFRTIQKAVNRAGSFKFKKKNRGVKVVVKVKPGKYVEGVILDGTKKKKNFNRLVIKGTKKNPRKTILEGKNAKVKQGGFSGSAQNGIEGISVNNVVLKNMWARNYQSNGFFLHSSNEPEDKQHCRGYTMNNLLASDNRSYGLFAKNCFGGKMINSAGWHQGDSAFYVGQTPCDDHDWTNHGSDPAPCQKNPDWTLLKNDKGYENVLGYSGTNSKYVKITDSAFYNNGAGIVPNTLDSEEYEPNGWSIFENNDVMWNNYNYFLENSAFKTVSGGLGELLGEPINYPTGVGVILFGSDGNIVRNNNIFGNYKWGVASFSGPTLPDGSVVANKDDDAKNLNNQIIDNVMGRNGADPNGAYDFWDDNTGGGNCWSGNTPGSSFADGNGSVPVSQIYPACPQAQVLNDQAKSYDFSAGLQANLSNLTDPNTLLGYVSQSPPQNQQCSWVRRVASHPAFKNYKPVEVTPQAGELSCK